MRTLMAIFFLVRFLSVYAASEQISPQLVDKINRILMDEILNGAKGVEPYKIAIGDLKKMNTPEAHTAIKTLELLIQEHTANAQERYVGGAQ